MSSNYRLVRMPDSLELRIHWAWQAEKSGWSDKTYKIGEEMQKKYHPPLKMDYKSEPDMKQSYTYIRFPDAAAREACIAFFMEQAAAIDPGTSVVVVGDSPEVIEQAQRAAMLRYLKQQAAVKVKHERIKRPS